MDKKGWHKIQKEHQVYNHRCERNTQVGEKAYSSEEEQKTRLMLADRPRCERVLEEGLDLRIANNEMSLKAMDTDENF